MGLLELAFQYAQSATVTFLRPAISTHQLAPKVFVIAMFDLEAANWLSAQSSLKLTDSFILPGLSRGYEKIHCTADGAVCLLIVGTALINAALSIAALTSSMRFDLSKTYFLLSGIGGVNPKVATIGSVAFARFAVQVDTQLEFDAREIPPTWHSGYVPLGAASLDAFPETIHGTEVYELNENLRQVAISLAKTATLEDSHAAAKNRALYSNSPGDIYHAATLKPNVVEGDITSSNTFWHGHLLSERMEEIVKIYTSGKADYFMTASEDNAVIEALLRAALQNQVDYSRIILCRAGSNFDRSHSKSENPSLPYLMDHGGVGPANRNLYLSGLKIVQGITKGWSTRFEQGIKADNYLGDVHGAFGETPDFGPGN